MSATFVGEYSKSVQKIVHAGLLSGQHVHLIGAPGMGKTTIAKAVLSKIYPGAYAYVRIDPSTRPEVFSGAVKLDVLMGESRIERNTADSVYSDKYKTGLLDEFPRANPVVLNQMIELLDRQTHPKDAVPMIATANFLQRDPQFEAVYDRLGLWQWVNATGVNVADVAMAQLGALSNSGYLEPPLPCPTAEEILDVRHMTPTSNSTFAIVDLIERLSGEAKEGGMTVNNRRVAQWAQTLFYVGAYAAKSADFKTVPPMAIEALQWAYPHRTPEDAAAWRQLTAGVGDPLGVALQEIESKALMALDALKNGRASMDRTQYSTQVAKVMADAQRELAVRVDDGTGRVLQTTATITGWVGDALRK